jgi:hypothetical protein
MIFPQIKVSKGASYNGSTPVSKTVCVGSIPAAPASKHLQLILEIFDLTDILVI